MVCLREQTSAVLSDLGGRDLLKVDVVAAAVNLIFLHVSALQLQTQLSHRSLKFPVSAVHLDVVLLQLLLVTDHLDRDGEELRSTANIMQTTERKGDRFLQFVPSPSPPATLSSHPQTAKDAPHWSSSRILAQPSVCPPESWRNEQQKSTKHKIHQCSRYNSFRYISKSFLLSYLPMNRFFWFETFEKNPTKL